MARIRIFGEFASPEEQREALQRLTRAKREKARREIRRKLEAETYRKAFKELGATTRKKRERLLRKLSERKVVELSKFSRLAVENRTEAEIKKLSERTVLFGEKSRVQRHAYKRERRVFLAVRFKKVRIKGTRKKKSVVTGYRLSKLVKRPGRKLRVRVPYGPIISPKKVRERQQRAAREAQIMAIKRAFGLRTKEEARKIDRLLIEVGPEKRRKVYEEVLAKYRERRRKR